MIRRNLKFSVPIVLLSILLILPIRCNALGGTTSIYGDKGGETPPGGNIYFHIKPDTDAVGALVVLGPLTYDNDEDEIIPGTGFHADYLLLGIKIGSEGPEEDPSTELIGGEDYYFTYPTPFSATYQWITYTGTGDNTDDMGLYIAIAVMAGVINPEEFINKIINEGLNKTLTTTCGLWAQITVATIFIIPEIIFGTLATTLIFFTPLITRKLRQKMSG